MMPQTRTQVLYKVFALKDNALFIYEKLYKRLIQEIAARRRNEKMAANFISGIISLAIGVVIMANVFIYIVRQTCTTGWNSSDVALWGLLTLCGIVGLLYGVLAVFGIV
jgi:uncharacterized membrane protein HdeD (DUF308 family)